MSVYVWWVVLGWLCLPTQLLARCPSSTGQREKNKKKKLMGRGTGSSSYCQQNRFVLGKMNLMPIKLSWMVRNKLKIKKASLSVPMFFPQAQIPLWGHAGCVWHKAASAAPLHQNLDTNTQYSMYLLLFYYYKVPSYSIQKFSFHSGSALNSAGGFTDLFLCTLLKKRRICRTAHY